MTKAEHTPGPWNQNGRHVDADKGNKLICSLRSDYADDIENAAFIVHACNSHYELFEALKTLTEYVGKLSAHDSAIAVPYQKAKNALARAKGGAA